MPTANAVMFLEEASFTDYERRSPLLVGGRFFSSLFSLGLAFTSLGIQFLSPSSTAHFGFFS